MFLSEFFSKENIVVDGEFIDLGYADSKGKNVLTYCDNVHYLYKALKNNNISAIIMASNIETSNLDVLNKAVVKSSQPRECFFYLYQKMYQEKLFRYDYKYGISEGCRISENAIISEKSFIGRNTIISDNVVIKDNVFIGDNCFIDVGSVIGNEGVLYTVVDGNTKFIMHAGIVNIGNYVTILANATIVKSVFPNMPTVVDDYSIIGISTTIGHEAKIGKNCKVLGNCVVAKNAVIQDNSLIGSTSVIRENIIVGANSSVKAGSIVVKNVKSGQEVSGNFAIEHSKNLKNFFKGQK